MGAGPYGAIFHEPSGAVGGARRLHIGVGSDTRYRHGAVVGEVSRRYHLGFRGPRRLPEIGLSDGRAHDRALDRASPLIGTSPLYPLSGTPRFAWFLGLRYS